MNGIVKFIFYIGFLFFGGGFLIAFGQFVLYNGFGNIFDYAKAENAKIEYDKAYINKLETTEIYYQYCVKDKLYTCIASIISSSIEKKGIKIDEIYYNETFPSLNYIGDNRLRLRQAKTGMVVMGFFFLFIFLPYLFADLDKWIGVYTRGEYKSSRH